MDSVVLEKAKYCSSSVETDGVRYAANTSLVNDDSSTSTIERLAADVNDLRERLKIETREQEHFESAILPRIESKERELRHFLIPRSLHLDTNQVTGIQTAHTTSTAISTTVPIQSTVPAVRPVPSLIGGLVKNSSDGSFTGALTPSGSQSPAKLGSSCASSNVPGYSSQSIKQTASSSELRKNHRASPNCDSSSEADPYNDVLVDPSVLLVFSRLRSAQEHCSALVSANQTDLQSFTFTQNSQNGKRIMLRVRVLKQENQELELLNRTGRATRLETEMLLRRNLLQDLKEAHADMEYLVEESEVETEALGSSLLVLQQRLHLARTMAQVLASALAAEDPSGELLKAVVLSKMPHQSVDWLLGSTGVEEKPETMVEIGEEVQAGDARPSPVIQPKQEAVNDSVLMASRDVPSAAASPPSNHKEHHVKRSRKGSSTDDDHRHSTSRAHHSTHKKVRLSTEDTAKTVGVVNEAIVLKHLPVLTSPVDSASSVNDLQSSRNSAMFSTPESIYDDTARDEHFELRKKSYGGVKYRNIFDEVSSCISRKTLLHADSGNAQPPPPTSHLSSPGSESRHSLTNGDQPD